MGRCSCHRQKHSAASRTSSSCTAGSWTGPGWQGVYDLLKKDGYHVSIVQNPTTTLADDVAVTKRMLAAQDGPAILVGHSYGGVVITEAGTIRKVAGLVYIAAFAPDKGESVSHCSRTRRLVRRCRRSCPRRTASCSSIARSSAASFAADVSPPTAAFMADSQVPWGVAALDGAVTEPAWKIEAELVPRHDRGQDDSAGRAARDVEARGATVVEVKGSHSVYVSQPKAVASLIAKAANGVALATR